MVSPQEEQVAEIKLPSRIGYERIAMECSAAFAKLIGLIQERIEDLKTVVAEACLNAMVHGNKGRHDANVIVSISFNGSAIRVSVIDEGKGITEFPKDPDIDGIIKNMEPPQGFGLFLIRQLSDQVEFDEITNQGHAVTMVVKIAN